MNIFRIFMIVLGVLMLLNPVIERMVKINNSMRGIQTKVTPVTIWTYRVVAIIWILIFLVIPLG